MKSLSIKAKLTLIVLLCTAMAATVLIGLVENLHDQSVQLAARQALGSAHKGFKNLEADDLRALSMTTEALLTSDKMRGFFVRRDRAGLVKYMNPVYDRLKQRFGVSIMLFVEPEPSKKMFLRMNAPDKFGDVYKARSFEDAIRTKRSCAGSELAMFGYALRCVSPWYDENHKLVGYFALADTYDNFLTELRKQTGDQYEMVGLKKLLDEKTYRTGQQRKRQRDCWDEFPAGVVLSSTLNDHGKADLGAEIANLPPAGRLLGTYRSDEKTFVKAVFPLIDASGKQIGGVFVLHDISDLENGLANVRSSSVLATVVLMLVLCGALVLVLNRLVFARLRHTMDVATRVVGGEFQTSILPASDDEVGKLEAMIEQFRALFVDVVQDLETRQEKD